MYEQPTRGPETIRQALARVFRDRRVTGEEVEGGGEGE